MSKHCIQNNDDEKVNNFCIKFFLGSITVYPVTVETNKNNNCDWECKKVTLMWAG